MLAGKASAVEALELQVREMAPPPEELDARLAALAAQLQHSQAEAEEARKEVEHERREADKLKLKLGNEAKAQHRIAEAATQSRDAAVSERQALARELAAAKKQAQASKAKVSDKDKARIKQLEDETERLKKERAGMEQRLKAAAERERKDKEAQARLKARCDALSSSQQAAGASSGPASALGTPGTPAASHVDAAATPASTGLRFVNPKSVLPAPTAGPRASAEHAHALESEVARLRAALEEREQEAERLRSVLMFRQDADAKGQSRDSAVEEYVDSMKQESQERLAHMQVVVKGVREELAAALARADESDRRAASELRAAKDDARQALLERDAQRDRVQALEEGMEEGRREVLALTGKVREAEAALAEAHKAHAAAAARAREELEAWRREGGVLRARVAELEDMLEQQRLQQRLQHGAGSSSAGMQAQPALAHSSAPVHTSLARAGAAPAPSPAAEHGAAVLPAADDAADGGERGEGEGKARVELEGHTDAVNGLASIELPGGRDCLIVSASSDASAAVWSARTGKRVASLSLSGKGVGLAVASLASPPGAQALQAPGALCKLAVASSDGHISTWQVSCAADAAAPPILTALEPIKAAQAGAGAGGRGELKALALLNGRPLL